MVEKRTETEVESTDAGEKVTEDRNSREKHKTTVEIGSKKILELFRRASASKNFIDVSSESDPPTLEFPDDEELMKVMAEPMETRKMLANYMYQSEKKKLESELMDGEFEEIEHDTSQSTTMSNSRQSNVPTPTPPPASNPANQSTQQEDPGKKALLEALKVMDTQIRQRESALDTIIQALLREQQQPSRNGN
ncbi:unnamed protein product [Caenorhabditis sp. 36 PRJEB53466]|nr:unnamed protein product [Caenorhabditis sp. 36 PRJEB53466]